MLLTGEIFPTRIPSKGDQSPSGSRYEEISVTADHVWIWPSLSSLHRSQFPGRLLESFVDPPDIRVWSRKCCAGVSILHVCAASSRRMGGGGMQCHQVAMLFDWAVTLIPIPGPRPRELQTRTDQEKTQRLVSPTLTWTRNLCFVH